MSFTVGTNTREVWTQLTTMELRQESLMLSLLTQEGTQPWVSGASRSHIAVPNFAAAVLGGSRSRGADWPTANEYTPGDLYFQTSGSQAVSTFIRYEDVLESPWAVRERTRSRQVYELGIKIDTEIISALRTGLEAANKNTLGVQNSVYVDYEAPYSAVGTGAGEMPRNAIKSFSLKAFRAGAYGPGDPIGRAWCLMPPEIYNILSSDMLDSKYGFDQVTGDVLQNNSFFTRMGWQGRLFGIDIFAYNQLPVATNTVDWTILFGVRNAAAAAVRPPLIQAFDATTNQVSSNPGDLLRQTIEWGYLELFEGLLHETSIESNHT